MLPYSFRIDFFSMMYTLWYCLQPLLQSSPVLNNHAGCNSYLHIPCGWTTCIINGMYSAGTHRDCPHVLPFARNQLPCFSASLLISLYIKSYGQVPISVVPSYCPSNKTSPLQFVVLEEPFPPAPLNNNCTLGATMPRVVYISAHYWSHWLTY